MKYKRGAAILLTAALVLTTGMFSSYAETTTDSAAATSGSSFTDISGHWAEANIKEAAGLKIAGGYPDGTFLPDNLIKREEFFKLLSNILTEKPDTTNTKIQFTDVVENEWYVPTIKIAVASGITSGYGDGTFGIGLMISRQEAAKVAGSVIPKNDIDDQKGAETTLDKGQIADWAYDYVDLMFKKGYMKGDTEGNFRPTMALTRAEAATILLNIKKNEPIIAANADELAMAGCMDIHSDMQGVFTKGEGTRSDPYQITTEEQLNHMRLHTTEGAFYVLKKNIAITKDYVASPPPKTSDEDDWSKGNFQPIGSKENPFKGNLFGNGYTISGLNIVGENGTSKGSDRPEANYTGLFGCLAPGSGVADLIIDASTITGNQYTGAIAGYNEGTIKNCQLGKKGIVEGNSYTGGIAGYSTQPLTSLRNMGTVTGNQSNTGGIVGYISTGGKALVYCQNEGEVKGKDKTGGITGTFLSTPDTSASIEECYNKGKVESDSFNAGGIAGLVSGVNNTVAVESCTNSGEVGGTGANGGIAGILDSKQATVTNCKNTGSVEGNGAGGIVGNNQGTVSYCYNSGSVKAKFDGGGIAAYQQDGEGNITKCYNEGIVSSDSCAGGILGENDSNVENCYNSGKVSGTSYVGGIAGKNGSSVTNVYSAGTVQGDTGVGSLIGRNSGYITNAYWLDSSSPLGVGLEDSISHEQGVRKVTHEELSGQKKISISDGFIMLIDLMNANNATSADKMNKTSPKDVWEYSYKILVPASGSTTVISDGGNIVPPLTMPNLDSTGNTIDPSDLANKYLYPSIIN
jgi:hypothetical protein